MRELVRAISELLPDQAALGEAQRELERRIAVPSASPTQKGVLDGSA
jgi:hypothetical protein